MGKKHKEKFSAKFFSKSIVIDITELEKEKQICMAMIRGGNAIKVANNMTEVSMSQNLISEESLSLTDIDNKLKSLYKSRDTSLQKRHKLK